MTGLEQCRAVLDKAKQSYAEGLFAGTSGNLSLRDPKTGCIAITPSSVPYPGMTVEDIVVIDEDGHVQQGRHQPSSEWRMHTGLYKLRPDIHAIVHTHSPFATAFAVVHQPIPVTLIEMVMFLYGDVPVAAYHPPGSAGLADSAAAVLHNRTACLMANHGVLAVGQTLDRAHIRAVYVEDAAKITHAAVQLGNLVVMSREEQNRIRREIGVPEE